MTDDLAGRLRAACAGADFVEVEVSDILTLIRERDEARAVWCRCAVAALAVMECGGEAKGACPACGCEEANSRNLWTCECPAPRPEAVGEDGG